MPRKTRSSASKKGTSKRKSSSRTKAKSKTKRTSSRAKSAKGSASKEKIFYKIGEVCQKTDTEPYVLRYWESEFPNLAPSKNRSGQRIYAKEDVQMVLRIKELLYDEGYTIAGARRKLEDEAKAGGPVAPQGEGSGDELKALRGKVRKIRSDLQEVLDLLS